VIGNHDRRAGVPPAEWNIECAHEPLVEPPFVYAHEPQKHPGGYVLAGHLHPSLTLYDVSGPALRSPCYWFAAHCGILPAFGSFTGTHSIDPQVKDHVFVVGPDAVLRVPSYAPVPLRRARTLRSNPK
jgi:metallophosphoesterase superfamily enzyme